MVNWRVTFHGGTDLNNQTNSKKSFPKLLADHCCSFNTGSPTRAFGNQSESVELNKVLQAILKKTEKLLQHCYSRDGTPRSKKLNFMTAICTLRILYARFLALYRWNIINQSRSISSRALSRQVANHRRVVTTLQSFSKHFSKMKIPSNHFKIIPNQAINTEFPIKIHPKHIAVQLIHRSKSFLSVKVSFSNNILIVKKPGEYSFKLKISPNGKRRIVYFNVNWPKDLKIDASVGFYKFLSLLSSTAKYSNDPINDCGFILHKLYQRGIFANIHTILMDIQSKNSFTLSLRNNEIVLTFPQAFSPFNVFKVSMKDNYIKLSSECPMYTPENSYLNACDQINTQIHMNGQISSQINSDSIDNGSLFERRKRFLSYKLTSNLEQIESIVSEICISTFYTRLYKLWLNISQSLSTISMHQFRGIFRDSTKCIEIYLFDYIIMRIEINPFSGDVIVTEFSGIGIDPDEFIRSIEGCECQRNEAIRIVFLHSLSKLLFGEVTDERPKYHISKTEVTRLTRSMRFSFSPDSYVVFGEKFGTPSLSIISPEGNEVSTPEIMLVKISNDDDLKMKSIEAAKSSKIAILLLQLVRTLKVHGISARLENNRVHFIAEPFECVEFEISQHSMWSLQFIKPSVDLNDVLTLSFVGSSINARFVDWIVHFVWNISTFMQMLKQASGVHTMRTIIKELDIPNKTQFTIKMVHDYCSALTCKITPITILSNSQGGEVYQVSSSNTPHINFSFSHHVQLKQHLDSILRSGSISFLFGSFLNSSFVPLQYFYKTFMGDEKSNWSVTALRDDGSFFLIFQREMSINFMVRPAQMFQLIIPSIGKCQVLQIPLEAMPKFCHLTKLSHTTLKLHLSQLIDFKHSIERFFNFRELLGKIGFASFRSNGHEVYSPFPVEVPFVNISCYIRPTKIEFEADGADVELAKNIKIVLNYSFLDVDIQILMIRFIINILAFHQKFVDFIVQFMAKMTEKTQELSLDWNKTLELSAVLLSEQKVILNFTTTRQDVFFVEISQQEGEIIPLIVGIDKLGAETKFKSLKELTRWVDNLEQSESD
ncbi:hypothetical protein TRFO_08763 [Tritrichomonas foetus]|uniref:Uncharacterized protein n=1 Tax=Tritrichomonas foetus TaxID=1144522 RepID=A0A1J4JMH7_9EUKA|nr:hypothetical protein TRFO_08763 [Tritrichomonas foetus]|eukprot:OHS98749.1 hypothetical protein TRFO_08763 [Tritrichomonas foetus]